MENTPSVRISVLPWPVRRSRSSARRSSRSLWPNGSDGRAGEPRAGPQAGMGELVDQHEIAAADQRRHDAGIGEIAGAEHAGRRGTLEPRQPRLQRVVERMVPGDEPRGAGADAIFRDRRRARRPPAPDGWRARDSRCTRTRRDAGRRARPRRRGARWSRAHGAGAGYRGRQAWRWRSRREMTFVCYGVARMA